MSKNTLRKFGLAAAMLTVVAMAASQPASAQLRLLFPRSPRLEGSVQSIHADLPTQVRFVNLSSQPVVTYWLDYTGLRVFYNTVPARQSYVQETFVTHPWLVTTTGGVGIVLYQPTVQPATAVITEAMVRAATRPR